MAVNHINEKSSFLLKILNYNNSYYLKLSHMLDETSGYLIIIVIIITFILIQEIGFTESLLNWKTLTGPNSANYLFYMSLHRLWKR